MLQPRFLALLLLLSHISLTTAVRLPPYDELHSEDAVQHFPDSKLERRAPDAYPMQNEDHHEESPIPLNDTPPKRQPKVISLPISYMHGQYRPMSYGSEYPNEEPQDEKDASQPKYFLYARHHIPEHQDDGQHEASGEYSSMERGGEEGEYEYYYPEVSNQARDPLVPYYRYHQRPAYTPSIQTGNPHSKLYPRTANHQHDTASRPEGCPPCRRCEAHYAPSKMPPCECPGGYRPNDDEDCICPEDRPYPSHHLRRSQLPSPYDYDQSVPILARDPLHHPGYTPLFGLLHARDYIPALDAPYAGEIDVPHLPMNKRSTDPDPLPKKKNNGGGKGKDANPHSYRCRGPRCKSLGMKMKMKRDPVATNMNAHGGHGQRVGPRYDEL